jgi:hypothetical protein
MVDHGRVWLAALLAVHAGACCAVGSCGAPRVGYTRTAALGPVVRAPVAGRWQQASVLAGWYDIRNPRSPVPEGKDLLLRLEGGSGKRDVPFGAGPYDQADSAYALVFAPDGHAVAVSQDRARWYYVGLDGGEEPFLCRHATIAATPDDLWRVAPTTRSLVLTFLRTPAKMVGGFPEDSHNDEREMLGAASYVESHPQDAELALALTRFLVADHPGIFVDYRMGDVVRAADVTGDVARRHAAARALLEATFRSAPENPRVWDRAALALGRIGDAAGQDLLATGLRATEGKNDVLDWALARAVTTHKSATPAARAALLATVDGDLGFEGRSTLLRGLAPLAGADVDAVLAKHAAGKCRWRLPSRLPDFRFPTGGDHDSDREWTLEPTCWAKLVVRSRRE